MTIEQLTYIVATNKSKTGVKTQLLNSYKFRSNVIFYRDGCVDVVHMTRCAVNMVSNKSFDARAVYQFKKTPTGAIFKGAFVEVLLPHYILGTTGKLKVVKGQLLRFKANMNPKMAVSLVMQGVNYTAVETVYYGDLEQVLRQIDGRDVMIIQQRSCGNKIQFYKGLDVLRNKIAKQGIRSVTQNGMYKRKRRRTGTRVY